MDFLDVQVRFFLLHWVRSMAMVGTLTIFSQSTASQMAKLSIGLMLGTIAGLVGDATGFDDPGFTPLLVVLIAKEFLLGALFAYLANTAFAALRVAGHIIGQEMGFNLASIQDPVSGVSIQIIAHFMESLGLVLFFSVDGHHVLVRTLVRSFEAYPVDQLSIGLDLLLTTVTFSRGVFSIGFQIASPVFASMLVISTALAVLAKVAPELQIMQFAFHVKVFAGLVFIIVALYTMMPAILGVFVDLEAALHQLVG